MNETDEIFLDFSVRKLELFMGRIDHCLDRLNEAQIWARGDENENAVGNLALHLAGNVRQWIVAGVGGNQDVRDRDGEFAARSGGTAAELKARLRAAVSDASAVIRGVSSERLLEPLTIQQYGGTVLEAIYHVVEHFAMHTGQILFATKMLTGADLGFYAHLSGTKSVTPAHGHKTP